MSLNWLQARHFRNLTHIELTLEPGLNLVSGANGSGKTSLLESIYFLSSGRSFRDNSIDPIIQRDSEDCLVRGGVESGGIEYQVGVSRNRDRGRDIRINGEVTRKATELAHLLPTLVLGPQSVDLLIGPPELRRRFLNWGVFHVEPGFTETWEEANRCLRQRNQLLREGVGGAELVTWSSRLADYASRIDRQRQLYVNAYLPVFQDLAHRLSGLADVSLDYHRGWSKDSDLVTLYENDREIEEKRGFTQKGFQRADVRIGVAGEPAARVCSRGELKSLVWAMILAQGRLAEGQEGSASARGTLYLVDDLASEFDEEHRRQVCRYLIETRQQVLMTGVDESALITACEQRHERLFHVKHGQVGS